MIEDFVAGYILGLVTIPAFIGAIFLLEKFNITPFKRKEKKQ